MTRCLTYGDNFEVRIDREDLNDETERIVPIVYPGIDILPLRVNINRYLWCVYNHKKPESRKVIIPHKLMDQERAVWLVCECSGLTQNGLLVWHTGFIHNFNKMLRQEHLRNYSNVDYISLLSDLWSFLLEAGDTKKNYKVLQDLKKRLLPYIKGSNLLEGTMWFKKEVFIWMELMNELIKTMQKLLPTYFKDITYLSTEEIERFHYVLLREMNILLHRHSHYTPNMEYVACLPFKCHDIIPNYANDIYHEYRNWKYDKKEKNS